MNRDRKVILERIKGSQEGRVSREELPLTSRTVLSMEDEGLIEVDWYKGIRTWFPKRRWLSMSITNKGRAALQERR